VYDGTNWGDDLEIRGGEGEYLYELLPDAEE